MVLPGQADGVGVFTLRLKRAFSRPDIVAVVLCSGSRSSVAVMFRGTP